MDDTVVIRPATASDAASLAGTIVAAFEAYRGRLIPESAAFRETADAISRELADGTSAIVAEQDGATLGCVMTKPLDGDLYFGRLAVIPSARGRGIVQRLVEAVEAQAARRGLAGVRLGVRVALIENQRLFTALGYVEISRDHPGFDHPCPRDDVDLSKRPRRLGSRGSVPTYVRKLLIRACGQRGVGRGAARWHPSGPS